MTRGPYCTGAAHPVRGSRFRLAAAAAAASQSQQLVLGRHRLHPRDVDDLAPLDRSDRRVLQGLPTAAALRRPVPHPLVRVIAELHRGTGLAFGRPGLRPVFSRRDFGGGLASPSDDGGLDEFRDATLAARSATCDCSPDTCSRSTAISAACPAIRLSRSASRSCSRAFAARSPAASSGTPGISARAELHHRPAPPANKRTSNQPQIARRSWRRRMRGRRTYLVTSL
jgi:hypothetical protein